MGQRETKSPLDYAAPAPAGRRRAMTLAQKWTLIVIGLCVGAAAVFVVLSYAYFVSLGPVGP